MGVDFSAILDVSIDWSDLREVPVRLDTVTRELSAIWGESPSRQRRWSLNFRDWCYYVAGGPRHDEDESVACRLHPGLEGPLYFGLVPHRGYATIGHLARWKFFLQEPEGVRDRLRRACKLMAAALGATQIMYVPDLALEEIAEHCLYDDPYERIVAHFRGAWGDASDFGMTYPIGVRYWERYFIESLVSTPPATP